MTATSRGQDPTSTFLDQAFETLIEHWNDGRPMPVEQLVAERGDLREEIERLARLVRRVAVQYPPGRPEIGGYDIYEELGRGAMGSVYLARQHGLNRLVALKVLPPAYMVSDKARQRFLLEARALARLRHPNIVGVHDVIEIEDVCAYAMDFIRGTTLARLLERLPEDRRPEVEDLFEAFPDVEPDAFDRGAVEFFCRVGIAVGRALDVVRSAGIVHRDVKPSNILLCTDGTALLSDFGLSFDEVDPVHTISGQFLGTPAYAAPEQLAGRNHWVDARSDVYSLGVTLYQAFTGRLPHAADGTGELLRRVEAGLHPPPRKVAPWLPRDLETIVEKAIHPDPGRRYEHGGELADDLQRFLELRPIVARRAGLASRTWKFVRRHRGPVSAAGVTGLVALVAVVLLLARQADLAQRREGGQTEALLGQAAWLTAEAGTSAEPPVHRIASRAGVHYDAAAQNGSLDLLDHRVANRVRWERALIQAAQDLVRVGGGSCPTDAAYRRPLSDLSQAIGPLLDDWSLADRLIGDPSRPTDLWSQGDHLAVGLLAYLIGAQQVALEELSRLDNSFDEDVLVKAILGRMNLTAGRMLSATSYLASVIEKDVRSGLLVLDFADALLADEPGRALQQLHEYEAAPDEELPDYYRALIFELENDHVAAIATYLRLLEQGPPTQRLRHALVRATRSWWGGEGAGLRHRVDAVLCVQDQDVAESNLHDLPAACEDGLAALRGLLPERLHLTDFEATRALWRPASDEERALPGWRRSRAIAAAILSDIDRLRLTRPDDADEVEASLVEPEEDPRDRVREARPLAVLHGLLERSGEGFGASLAVDRSSEPPRLAVGARDGDYALVFELDQLDRPLASFRDPVWPDGFGVALAFVARGAGSGPAGLAVGAIHDDRLEPNAGVVHVFPLEDSRALGQTGLEEARSLLLDLHDAPVEDATLGAYVVELDDVDGDGLSDLAASAHHLDQNAGAVVAWSARTGRRLWRARGSAQRCGLGSGSGLLLTADLDGDGLRDVLAGGNDPEGAPANRVMGMLTALSSRDGTVLWTVSNGQHRDGFGVAAVMLGSGESSDSLVLAVGAAGVGGGAGCVFLSDLRTASPGVGPQLSTRFDAGPHQQGFGSEIADIGDLDGDGHDDLIVLASRDSRSAAPALGLTWVSGADPAARATVLVRRPSASDGVALARLPDLDGDGLDEVALGVASADDFGVRMGKVVILPGSAWVSR